MTPTFHLIIGIACGVLLGVTAAIVLPVLHADPARRFIWIGNPANVETWNGACLDLDTRLVVASIHCEQ